MGVINLTKDSPAGSQLLMIDVDFLKSLIPALIGLSYDRPGNFVCNKDISKIYCRNATGWELVKLSGGGGAAYLAGQGINISNNKISAAVDGTTISFNSAGQLVSAVSPDATTKNFTLANTTVVDTEKEGLKKAMTTGDSMEDTLVWTDGEITWSFEATNDDLLFGYGEVSCYSIETYDPFNPKIDYYLPFGFDETDTVKYKGMKWKVQTEDNIDTFTCIMIKQDGTEVASEAQVITGCICHFEILTNATNIHATAASGKLHDPINPLPHDKRLDNAFDEQGYVVIGNKRIQLRDVSNMSVKDMEPTNMFTFYDGTYTYIYDYFRKDYALIENSDHKTTSIELPLMTTLTVGQPISCGLYDAEGKEELTSILLYTPEEDDNITIIKYVINWNSTQSKFNAKCYLLDPSHTIIAQTLTAVQVDGPCGIYIKLKGLIEISKFVDVYAIKNISARYTRFNTAASEADYSMADENVYWRDSFHAYNEAAHKYGEFIMFGAGQFKEFEDFAAAPRNYYMTNGKFRFTVDRTESGSQQGLPYGEWTLGWANKEGKDIVSKTITETSTKYITGVQFLRENVYGMSIMIKYNDDTYEHHHAETALSRDEYGSLGIVYTAETSFNMKPFNMMEYNGVYERSSNIDIATADSYGAVKIDNDTIKVNTSGQIYTTNSGGSYTAGGGINITNNTISAKADGYSVIIDSNGYLKSNMYTEDYNSGIKIISGYQGYDNISSVSVYRSLDTTATMVKDEEDHWGLKSNLYISYNNNYNTLNIDVTSTKLYTTSTTVAFAFVEEPNTNPYYFTTPDSIEDAITEIDILYNGEGSTGAIDIIIKAGDDIHEYTNAITLNNWKNVNLAAITFNGPIEVTNMTSSNTVILQDFGLPTYNTNKGIEIIDNNVQVKYDNSTIKVNSEGQLYATGGSSDDTFIAIYPTTSLENITAAYNAGKTIFCKYTNDNTTCIMNLDYAGTNAEGSAYFEFSSVDTDKYLNCVSIDSLNGWGEVMHYQLGGGSDSLMFKATVEVTTKQLLLDAIAANKIIYLIHNGLLYFLTCHYENTEDFLFTSFSYEIDNSNYNKSYLTMDTIKAYTNNIGEWVWDISGFAVSKTGRKGIVINDFENIEFEKEYYTTIPTYTVNFNTKTIKLNEYLGTSTEDYAIFSFWDTEFPGNYGIEATIETAYANQSVSMVTVGLTKPIKNIKANYYNDGTDDYIDFTLTFEDNTTHEINVNINDLTTEGHEYFTFYLKFTGLESVDISWDTEGWVKNITNVLDKDSVNNSNTIGITPEGILEIKNSYEDRIVNLESKVKELTALVEKLTMTEEPETEEPKVKE